MESKAPVVKNNDTSGVAEKSKTDIQEVSGSQVSSCDETFHESASDFRSPDLVPDIHLTKPNLFINRQVPESELATGSAGGSSDPKGRAPLTLTPASGPPPKSGNLDDTDDNSARPWSPDAKNGSAHQPAERSQSSSSSLKEFTTYFRLHDYNSSRSSSHGDLLETNVYSQERKTFPDLPDYTSSTSSSPEYFWESNASSQEAKTYPDLRSQATSSPGNFLESKASSPQAKTYPDLPDYTSSSSSLSPGNWLETEDSSCDDKGPKVGNFQEDSVDLNWRKSVEAAPGIAPAVDHHAEDSNST